MADRARPDWMGPDYTPQRRSKDADPPLDALNAVAKATGAGVLLVLDVFIIAAGHTIFGLFLLIWGWIAAGVLAVLSITLCVLAIRQARTAGDALSEVAWADRQDPRTARRVALAVLAGWVVFVILALTLRASLFITT